MLLFPIDGTGVAWFVTLPDTTDARPLAESLRAHANRVVEHPSGRPWLLARWEGEDQVVARTGDTTIVVFGEHDISRAQLTRMADRIRGIGDLDAVARSIAGSVHLAASVGGRQRVQGSVLGMRPVFHGRTRGIDVLSNRADVLAWLTGAGIDADRLSLHLAAMAPVPLHGQPVWRGVQLVPGECYAEVTPAGAARQVEWWQPPEPVLPIAEGAARLREAVIDAVRARHPTGGTPTSDLAGLDSTSVCGVLAAEVDEVRTLTAANADTRDDDVLWAKRTASALGNVRNEVIDAADIAPRFHGLRQAAERFDQPCAFAADRSRIRRLFEWAAERHSTRHFSGFGGDELFTGSPAWVSSYLWSSPAQAVRNFRGHCVQGRWPRRAALAQLLDPRPYRRWLRQAGERLGGPARPSNYPALDWGFEPELCPWATSDTVAALCRLFRSAASTARPLSPIKGMHSDLMMMRGGAGAVRQFRQLAAQAGVVLSAPYYDDRVVEAGLSVRPQDRVGPFRYKPVVKEAMRDIVPHESLTRETKGDGATSQAVGLDLHRGEILDLLEDSRLAALGLVDGTAMIDFCRRPIGNSEDFATSIYPVIACELWLRTVSGLEKPGK